MTIALSPVAKQPNTEGIGDNYLVTFNTVAAGSGELRMFPKGDEHLTLKDWSFSVTQAGYYEIRKIHKKDISTYEVLERNRWESGDRIISTVDKVYEIDGEHEVIALYIYMSSVGLYTINLKGHVVKQRVWDAMQKLESQKKGEDLRIG